MENSRETEVENYMNEIRNNIKKISKGNKKTEEAKQLQMFFRYLKNGS
jgi:hypothetical protein